MSSTLSFETGTTTPVSRIASNRVAGIAAVAFAVVVGLVNVFIGSLQPPAANANASDIVGFVNDNKAGITVAFAAIPAGVFLLFAFVAGVMPRISTTPESGLWARFGLVGIVLVECMFLTRSLSEAVLVANIDRFAGEPTMIEVLWQMQAAAQTANGLALAVALVGLSRAAHLSGLIPDWQQVMGFAGATLFVVGSVAIIPGLEGSPVALVGLVAFVSWLVWLGTTGVRLLREDTAAA